MRTREQPDQNLLLRELIDALPLGIGMFDADARLVYANPALARLNPRLSDLFEPGLEWDRLMIEMVARGTIDLASQEKLRALEARLDDADGAPVHAVVEINGLGIHEVMLSPLSDGGFAMDQRDVTSREMAEEQDREADALLRQVMEACPANLVMSRMDDGQIIYRSPAAREVLGPGRKVNEHFVSHRDLADFITTLLPEGRIDEMFAQLRNTDGHVFPSLVSSRMIEYRGEDVAISSLVDITKEVEMRKMLAAQRERIFEAEKLSALGELLAGVAHELNNPLSVVVGHALMLEEETTDPEVLRRVEQIGSAAERCAGIVKSFLAMAREQKVEKQVLSLRKLIDDTLTSLAEAGREFDLAVETSIPDDAPPLCGDAAQLEQVLTNLLINAQQAIAKQDEGPGTVTINAKPDRARQLMVIDMADDGPGIPERIGKRVFEPLFTTKEVGKGTGIGLAFCHRVLTAHGGSIELLPSERGAHFRIHVPISKETDRKDATGGTALAADSRGTVLVIDDEDDVASLIAEILRRDGFAVDVAHSAEQGLENVAAAAYDAMLVDVRMPGLGGEGFLREIRKSRPDLVGRIAFVTGSMMAPETRTFLDESGCRFLEKPVAPKDLRSLAREVVARGRT